MGYRELRNVELRKTLLVHRAQEKEYPDRHDPNMIPENEVEPKREKGTAARHSRSSSMMMVAEALGGAARESIRGRTSVRNEPQYERS